LGHDTANDIGLHCSKANHQKIMINYRSLIRRDYAA